MLGFSPLASAPLGDDGAVAEVIYLLNAQGITTGSPVVDSSSITQDHLLNTQGIATGNPTLGQATLTETAALDPQDITTGQPTLGASTLAQGHDLSANNITTGNPVVPDIIMAEEETGETYKTGRWVIGYTVENKPLEQAQEAVRNKRNRLLAETDWMALSDNIMSPAWASYRQALRDITAQAGFPYAVEWPTKPT